jgi:hypothetical protein
MKMKYSILFFLLLAAATLVSCYRDNEEDIYQFYNLSNSGCDTTVVTYTKQMKTFFDAKCNSCHTSNAVCNFDTYQHAYDYAKNNGAKLYSTVTATNHQSVSLTTCEKSQLRKWSTNPAE